MKVRFVRLRGNIYIVTGIVYESSIYFQECFVLTPLEHSIKHSIVFNTSFLVPIDYCEEITDKTLLELLLLLYGTV